MAGRAGHPGDRPRFADHQWERLASLARRRPFALFALSALLFFGSLPAAVQLYGDLRTDLRELLPQGAPAAVALQQLEKRVGGLSHLAIVVRTDDLAAGERFVDALTARLRTLPGSLIGHVRSRIDPEREFFDRHGALLADPEDLRALRDGLRSGAMSAQRRDNPLALSLDDDEETAATPGPTLTPEQTVRLRSAIGSLDHFLDGYLAGEGGHTLVVQVTPASAAVSLGEDKAIFDAAEQAVREVGPARFHPSIHIGYGGEVPGVIEAQEALVRDLLLSSILVLVAVAAALLLYYRTVRAIPLLVMPLFTGVALSLALSRAVIHYLNPNTAFLGSIIVGNGINAGIILLARYLEERRRGHALSRALPIALKTTWLGTFVASAGAAVSYGSLGAVQFRGFNQFGFMGFTGMLLCWMATYAFMPPLIVLQDRFWPLRERPASALRATGWLAGPFASAVLRRPVVAVGITLGLIVGAGVAIAHFAKDPVQYDFRRLGSRVSLKDGAAYWDRHVDAVLQSYQSPTVVMTESPEDADKVAAALDAQRRAQGPNGHLDQVATLHKLVPVDQELKLGLLRDIFARLTPRVVAALPIDLRDPLLRLRDRTELRSFGEQDVPPQLLAPFREKGGQEGRLVLAFPTLSTDGSNGRAQIAFADGVRDTVAKVAPTAHVAGQIVLTADIVEAVTHDGFVAGLLSFVAVSLLTALVMRSLRHALWVLGSLCLGVFWMFGALGGLSLKFNFVNFVVLPITFGIGVDYAVNFYQRYRQTRPGPSAVEDALRGAGGAVALCSATTIIGYAALVIADNQAIQSFGITAVLGELTCLSAALFALPAVLAYRDRKRFGAPAGPLLRRGTAPAAIDGTLDKPAPPQDPAVARSSQGA